MMQQRSAEQR